jgi:hypothetical protein
MYGVVAGFHSRALLIALALSALQTACGGDEGPAGVSVHARPDAGMPAMRETDSDDSAPRCESIEVDGEVVIEHERDFTARFRVVERYTKTVMLFGGETVNKDNVLSNAYIFGLDKMDALMLAQTYPDFYLCSSAGGQEAAKHIIPYDLLPATCEVHDRLVAALRQYGMNVAAGGDRTSIRFDGARLQLESVTADATGEDVTDQASDQDFHLVTAIEQLTGESVLSFGTTK